MAARNNLYLFAWLCAIALPLALQWLVGANEDVRNYVGDYYGPFTLYMLFTMTYGFATVFTAYYQISGYRQAGTLDLLRLTSIRPIEVVGGAFLQLEHVLVPPVIAFALLFIGYMLISPEREQARGFGWQLISSGAMIVLFNQAILVAFLMVGLYRRTAMPALIATVLVLPLNSLPVALVYALHVPAWLFLLILIGVLALLLAAAVYSVGRLWPPQRMPLKER